MAQVSVKYGDLVSLRRALAETHRENRALEEQLARATEAVGRLTKENAEMLRKMQELICEGKKAEQPDPWNVDHICRNCRYWVGQMSPLEAHCHTDPDDTCRNRFWPKGVPLPEAP